MPPTSDSWADNPTGGMRPAHRHSRQGSAASAADAISSAPREGIGQHRRGMSLSSSSVPSSGFHAISRSGSFVVPQSMAAAAAAAANPVSVMPHGMLGATMATRLQYQQQYQQQRQQQQQQQQHQHHHQQQQHQQHQQQQQYQHQYHQHQQQQYQQQYQQPPVPRYNRGAAPQIDSSYTRTCPDDPLGDYLMQQRNTVGTAFDIFEPDGSATAVAISSDPAFSTFSHRSSSDSSCHNPSPGWPPEGDGAYGGGAAGTMRGRPSQISDGMDRFLKYEGMASQGSVCDASAAAAAAAPPPRPATPMSLEGGPQRQQSSYYFPLSPVGTPHHHGPSFIPPAAAQARRVESPHVTRPNRFHEGYDESMEETIKPIRKTNQRTKGIFEDLRRQAEGGIDAAAGEGIIIANTAARQLPPPPSPSPSPPPPPPPQRTIAESATMTATDSAPTGQTPDISFGGAFLGSGLGIAPEAAAASPNHDPTPTHHDHNPPPIIDSANMHPSSPLAGSEVSTPFSVAHFSVDGSGGDEPRDHPAHHRRRSDSIASMASAASIASISIDEARVDTGIESTDIEQHIRGPSLADGKWECGWLGCDKRFGRKENIKSHVQTHLNDRQYQCPTCHKCFVRQHDLKRHAKIHTGVKPYLCDCGNSFARHDALTRHRQRGMCVGAFDGVVRKVVKRGRPRKNRDPAAAAADRSERKAAQRRKNQSISSVASSSCSVASSSSSISAYSSDCGSSSCSVPSSPAAPAAAGGYDLADFDRFDLMDMDMDMDMNDGGHRHMVPGPSTSSPPTSSSLSSAPMPMAPPPAWGSDHRVAGLAPSPSSFAVPEAATLDRAPASSSPLPPPPPPPPARSAASRDSTPPDLSRSSSPPPSADSARQYPIPGPEGGNGDGEMPVCDFVDCDTSTSLVQINGRNVMLVIPKTEEEFVDTAFRIFTNGHDDVFFGGP